MARNSGGCAVLGKDAYEKRAGVLRGPSLFLLVEDISNTVLLVGAAMATAMLAVVSALVLSPPAAEAKDRINVVRCPTEPDGFTCIGTIVRDRLLGTDSLDVIRGNVTVQRPNNFGGCLDGTPNELRIAGPEGAVVITNHYGGEGTVENFNFANIS